MLRVFLGFDSREPVAYHVAAHSIITTASAPVAIIPLVQSQLRTAGLYTRERGKTEATEFSMTRFLVPYLSDYKGWSIFMDCDMVVRRDIYEIFNDISADSFDEVACCQHDYTPKSASKMDGQTQTTYPRKNWSSLMLFWNERCTVLTPEYVSTASGLDLHRFNWAKGWIQPLPLEWNWLVGEYPPNPDAKILHYTNGGPWFAETRNCDHKKDWTDIVGALNEPYRPSQAPWARENWMAQADGVP